MIPLINDFREIFGALAMIALTYVLPVMIRRAFRVRHGVKLGAGYHIAALAFAGFLAHAVTGFPRVETLGEICEIVGIRPAEDTLHTGARRVYRIGPIVAAFSGAGVLLSFARRFLPGALVRVAPPGARAEVPSPDRRGRRVHRGHAHPGRDGARRAYPRIAYGLRHPRRRRRSRDAGHARQYHRRRRRAHGQAVPRRRLASARRQPRAGRRGELARHTPRHERPPPARIPEQHHRAHAAGEPRRARRRARHAHHRRRRVRDAAKAALLRATRHTEGVLADPQPVIRLRDFGDNAVVYDIKFFLADQEQYPEIADGIRTHVWYELHREGMRIPMPMRTLRIDRPHEASQAERRAEITRSLAAQPLFSHLHGHEADRLVAGVRTVPYGVGEAVVKTGETGESLFLVVSGVLRVDIFRDGVRHTVARLKAGECFGEMSLLTGEPRGADVVAETDCELLEVSKEAFAAVIAERRELIPVLGEMLARRRAGTDALFDALPHGERDAEMRRRGADMLRRISDFFALR